MASPKLPVLPARKVIKALIKDGFVEQRATRGSHRKFKKTVDNYVFVTLVPINEKYIARRLLLTIIKQAGHTKESFLELL